MSAGGATAMTGAIVLCRSKNQSTVRSGAREEARLVAISQILLGQLGRVQTKIFQELPRLPRAIQDGQAGQATESSFWPQDPKTSQDNPAHSAKLDFDLRRPTNDDTASAVDLVNRPIRLRISAHRA